MLSPGDQAPGIDPETDVDTMFGHARWIVPTSGLQFHDLSLARGASEGVVRRFFERRFELSSGAVWALAEADTEPPAGHALSLDAAAVLRAARGTWLPLPLLRFVNRDETGRAQFDIGPTNWARIYIGEEDPGRAATAGVVALDTDIDARARSIFDSYTTPTVEDVRFGSTFAMTDDATALAPFLAQEWVQAWLTRVFEAVTPPPRPGGAPKSAGLGSIAAYLTLLTILRRAGVMPSFQFIAPAIPGPKGTPVDLVLDLGTTRTAAVLVEGHEVGARAGVQRAALLAVRDLTTPTLIHTGALASGIVFARAEFGPDALSRRSGRPDAFRWPSLARLGPEAERLAAVAPPADGAIGVRTPKAHVMDVAPRAEVWRFAPDPRQPLTRRPMLAGPLLGVLPDIAGLLPAPHVAPRSLAETIRPRFSLSSTLSFLMVEVLSQALAVINAPASDTAEATGAPRYLRQIVLTLPLAMPLVERQILRERAEAAIDMLWSALGWANADVAFAPAPPSVRLGLDETLCAQLVHLYDEIADRFAGDARACFETLGTVRPEFGLAPSLRLGAIDIGGGHAHATIVTYALGDRGLASSLFGTQRSAIAGEQVLTAIVQDVLAPAVTEALQRAGHTRPDAVVARLLAPPSVNAFVREQWWRPAAIALLGALDGRADTGLAPTWTTCLAHLAGADRPMSVAAVLALQKQAGIAAGDPCEPSALPIDVSLADVAACVQSTLAPMLSALVRPMLAAGCDVVLLSGWMARLPLVHRLVVEAMPWRPDRILILDATTLRPWSPLPADTLAATAGKGVALLGSLLALGGGERFGFGDIDTASAPDLDTPGAP